MALRISPSDLIDMALYLHSHPLKIDVVYANAHHAENIFGCALYRENAPLLLHKDLAQITLKASELLYSRYQWTTILMDGLRPIEAQAAMQETEIVKRNPHWCEDGPRRLLSPPGKGGHPRGMAIDIVCEDKTGQRIDMGTPFDYLTEDRDNNPAARDYKNLSAHVLQNRQALEDAMVDAATHYALEILPLPSEWWDFRFPAEHYNQYAPLSDNDLMNHQKICAFT